MAPKRRAAPQHVYWSEEERTPAGETLLECARKYGTGGWEDHTRDLGAELVYLDATRSDNNSWLLATYRLSTGEFIPARLYEKHPVISRQELVRMAKE